MPFEVLLIKNLDDLPKHERKMSHFFKCTVDLKKCCYTGNAGDAFLNHLKSKHPSSKLFCYLCHELQDKNKRMQSPAELIEHQLYEHGFRIYQCNLCLYRSARLALLNMHHNICHFDNYCGGGSGIRDVTPSKAIFCPRVVEGPHVNDDIFFLTYRSKRINRFKTPAMFQCLFCSFLSSDLQYIWVHIVANHPDRNFCAYDPDDDATRAHITSESCIQARSKEIEMLESLNTNTLGTEIQDMADGNVEDLRPTDPEPMEIDSELTPPDVPKKPDEKIPSGRRRQGRAPIPLRKPKTINLPIDEDHDDIEKSEKRQRSAQLDHRSVLDNALPITNRSIGAAFYCVICEKAFPSGKKNQHLKDFHHNAGSALKCSRCDTLGQQDELRQHIQQSHAIEGASIIKFIVPSGEKKPEVIKEYGPIKLAKSPTKEPGYQLNNGKRGPLMENILDSTFLGPLRNEKTGTYEKQQVKIKSISLTTTASSSAPTGLVTEFNFDQAEQTRLLLAKFNIKPVKVEILKDEVALAVQALRLGGTIRLNKTQPEQPAPSVADNNSDDEIQVVMPEPKTPPPIVDIIEDEEDFNCYHDDQGNVDDLEAKLKQLDS